ncbi:leukocyte immunoglobulin-like receptor subfamily A member 5 isoform X2 [Petaurus breviceps papuanus]|uniref:leukocyte immunoglobulin-like receptor subfamily A member 5 isoform X2 n=1 Tax=Petaurus breviceps papuanus TaxID=3040969 RepID=UPI0036D9F8A7
MSSFLIALLCFGLCLGMRIRAEAGSPPGPSLWIEPGPLIPYGNPVTLWCRGPPGAHSYYLKKEGSSEPKSMHRTKSEAKFPISSVTEDTAGSYYCFYHNGLHWSEGSEFLQLVVTGLYSKPSLSALPSPKLASRQKVTLCCQSEYRFDSFILIKEEGASTPQHWRSGGQADFPVPAETAAYRCYSFHSQQPLLWTAPSDLLELKVTAPQDYTTGNLIRLCLAGLLLLILGVLLAEAWYSRRRHREAGQETLA